MVSRVLNERTKQKFVISTALNSYGVWETAVFETNETFTPLDLTKPLLVVNASNRSQAKEQHKQAAALFRTKEPSMLAKHYHLEKILPLGQLVYSESKENMNLGGITQNSSSTSTLKQTANKYRFWTMTQKISLFLFLVFLVACFIWSWWALVPTLIFLTLNAIAYTKRMKSLGRDPVTKDINEVI
ncbi:MAG: hypothetical protein ABGF52_13670 [Candidatus Asgardarchaeum sp.]